MKKKQISFEIEEYLNIYELNDTDKKLVYEAQEATKSAYAPYSNFQVGAAVLLENGEIVRGNNQENSAYPSGLCAERVALFYANSKFPKVPVKAIAICAFHNKKFTSSPIPPCGSCRQVMLETEMRFDSPIRVIMYGSGKIQAINSIKNLLPLNFTGENLNK